MSADAEWKRREDEGTAARGRKIKEGKHGERREERGERRRNKDQ